MTVANGLPEEAYDLIGVGFGPSNLALSIAAAEAAERGLPLRRVFLERKPSFGWHRGMLIDGATIQVSFLKDLTTLRNPVSRFGFVAYLWAKGRLSDFINHKTLFPSRLEYHDYLEWAATQVAETTVYATEVESVRPVVCGETVTHLDVMVRRCGAAVPLVRRTRNLVIGVGLRPQLPSGVPSTERVWHSSALLDRVAGLDRTRPYRFVVVGAGQSAAEVVAYLHSAFSAAEVYAVFGRYGYSPSDDSPFANRVFDPAAVDDYFDAPEAVKQKFFDYHANTNYSVVDVDLLHDLYGRVYRQSVTGRRRLFVHHMSTATAPEPVGNELSLSVTFLPTGRRTQVRADYAIFATGYAPMDPMPILGATADLCERDDRGRLRVERDYRVVMRPGVRCGIYLQGGTEHTHGISSSLLSNVAVRAGEILNSIQLARALTADDSGTPTADRGRDR